MATINDIVNLDSRRGDVAAGGGDAGAFQIDTRPLQTLGLYTNFYNQTLYHQTVRDRDEKLVQVAKISDIDANNLFGKDKEYLVKKLNNLREFATQYAKNPNLTIDDQLKWQTALSDVNNDYLSGKQRAVTYQARLNDINTNYSGEQKDIKLRELDNDFQNTDIATQLSTGTGYKPVSVDLPAPATLTFNTLKNGANEVVDVKSTVYNPKANAALASASVLGVSSLANGLTGTEAELQQTANGEAQHWAGMTDAFNAVLTAKDANGGYKYFDANGQFLADKFKTENAANTAIMQPYNALVNLNTYSTQKKQEIANGVYTDKGISYQAPANLTPDMFDAGIVNFTPNGISKEQLAQGGMFQKYLGDQNVKTFKETGLGIAQQNADTARMNAKTNQAELGLKREEFKYKKDNPTAKAPKGETTLETPAILFGNHIARLKKIFSNPKVESEVVSVNAIDKDTRQAMGISNDNIGDIKSVTYRKDGSYAINFKNDEVTDESGNKVKQQPIIGTIEQLKQGYIDAVRGGNTNAQGFQEKSEQGFSDNFGGLVDGKQIWDNWNAKPSDNVPKDSKVVELTGQVDPAQLRQGQVYLVNGKNYIWDGSKLKAQ